MTITRIEHEDGYGLFFSHLYDGISGRRIKEREVYAQKDFPLIHYKHSSKFARPEFDTPSLNPTLGNKEWFCAYHSIYQLCSWYSSKELKSLINKGFKILILDVIQYQEGSYQVLYTKDSIISVSDITNLFK